MSPITKLFSSPKMKEAVQPSRPNVSAEPSAPDAEKLRRVGRAALIATSAQGVLGNPTTGRKQLLSA